ncbi:hypothetical protein D3C84_1150520 [compost metagenome]
MPSTLTVIGVSSAVLWPPSFTAVGTSSTISMVTVAEALAIPSPTLIRKPSVSGPAASTVVSLRL